MSTADEEPRSASTQDALQNTDATNDAAATPVDLNSSGQNTKRDKEKQRNESPPENQTANVVNTLLPKLLRTTRMLLSSRSFFFLMILTLLEDWEIRILRAPSCRFTSPLIYWLVEGYTHFDYVRISN